MRIKITFQFSGKLRVPLHHQSLLHGLIYHLIRDETYRNQLHNEGFAYEKRQFRMFCFSKLHGRYAVDEQHLVFSSPVSFLFTSHDEKLIRELASSLFTRESIRIGSQTVKLSSIEQVEQPVSARMLIRTITPITVYSTFLLNNKKKTYFYNPKETEFAEQIQANACKKYTAIHGMPPQDPELRIRPYDGANIRPQNVQFKQTFIRGWSGLFILEGNQELIQTVYEVGIGSKNSNAMGLFEIVRHLEKEENACPTPSLRLGN